MIPTTSDTREIHDEYCKLTRLDSRYSMQTHFVWESWLAQGYTRDDLALVVGYIWRRIKAGKRERESFKLSVLIGNLSRWEEDLAIAKSERTIASKTVAVDAGRASALRSSGRRVEVPSRAITTPAAILGKHPTVPELLQKLKESVL